MSISHLLYEYPTRKLTVKTSLLIQIIAPLSLCFVKNSVLILYLRVFSVLRWLRIASITGIVAITAFHTSMAISLTVLCTPSSGTSRMEFLAASVSPRCFHIRKLVVVQGVASVATDLFLLILPLPAVWTLKMPLRRKVAVSTMFLTGIS